MLLVSGPERAIVPYSSDNKRLVYKKGAFVSLSGEHGYFRVTSVFWSFSVSALAWFGGGPQDSRFTSCVGRMTVLAGKSGLPIRFNNNSASCRPNSSVKTWTEVSGGCKDEASRVSLKPATLRSAGMANPLSLAALQAPLADESSPAKMAVSVGDCCSMSLVAR
jgi:hypothetical protein